MFVHYPDTDKYVDGKVMSIDSRYRKHGISVCLTDKTFEFMKQSGIPIYLALCSSHFSARVCEILEFIEVYRIAYKDYLGADGKPIFNTTYPHLLVRAFTINPVQYFAAMLRQKWRITKLNEMVRQNLKEDL